MAKPGLCLLAAEADYRTRYLARYYRASPLATHDGMQVFFFPEQFEHAFRRDSAPGAADKAHFDWDRARRIDWIEAQIQDDSLPSYRRIVDGKLRRIFLDEAERYAVVIQINKKDIKKAKFITAYVIDSASALTNMKTNQKWR